MKKLQEALQKIPGKTERVEFLDKIKGVQTYLKEHPIVEGFIKGADLDSHLIIKGIIAIGQAENVFFELQSSQQLKKLVEMLLPCEQFFYEMGGIAAYQSIALELIESNHETECSYQNPPGVDISENSRELDKAIRLGIENLDQMGEIYPVGGAGDRLNLTDEATSEPLPAAELPFCGRSLLEGLIRDLEAREYLYWKLLGIRTITPIVMMTSYEKDNHTRIINRLENNRWFGRPKESFFFVQQPLVPVITASGKWSLRAHVTPLLKPGGHGVIWKLCKDNQAFLFLEKQGRKKAIVRQINNPIAGTDNTLIALSGIGLQLNKLFGYASCSRLVSATEGMIVLKSSEDKNGKHYSIVNLEYTDFTKHGIADKPEKPKSPYSKYPANTNILFVDIQAIQEAVKQMPLPGKLINFKTTGAVFEADGTVRQEPCGRLESTMQNISDCFVDTFHHVSDASLLFHLKTFVTFNEREKTISVTKQSYKSGKSIQETPEGAYYQLMKNNYRLLQQECGMNLPSFPEEEEYIRSGLNFVFEFHPSLGPLWSVIRQKIQGGKFHRGSYFLLEAADVEISDLHLQGCLIIRGDIENSSLILKKVNVKNKGISVGSENRFWSHQVTFNEKIVIRLSPHSEFIAENVTLQGNLNLEVPTGYRMRAVESETQVKFVLEHMETFEPIWRYSFDENDKIKLISRNSRSL